MMSSSFCKWLLMSQLIFGASLLLLAGCSSPPPPPEPEAIQKELQELDAARQREMENK